MAMYPHEHDAYNHTHYPGTLQLCGWCDEPTGRCEEDTLWADNEPVPLCENCWLESQVCDDRKEVSDASQYPTCGTDA